MDSRDVISIYRTGVIQIATPFSTGTGFYLKEYDLIVTNEHVVRDNKEVVIDGDTFEKQIVEVCYVDPKYDLAFLHAPNKHEMPELKLGNFEQIKEGDQVIAIGHPFGFEYTATQGIISNMLHKQDEIEFIQHDAALNPGNSGGPLVDKSAHVIGVNTFIIRNGNNIGFSLPIKYLTITLEEFLKGNGQAGVRCNSCLNLVFDRSDVQGYCPKCGSTIKMISDLESYEPMGINKTVEDMLSELGFDINLSRRGPYNWQVVQGSAKINISYHEKSGLIISDAYLCSLPKENIHSLYEYLLQRNYELGGLTFSVKGNDIIISLLIYDQYLNLQTAKKLFEHMFQAADDYDNILVEQFGAIWKTNEK